MNKTVSVAEEVNFTNLILKLVNYQVKHLKSSVEAIYKTFLAMPIFSDHTAISYEMLWLMGYATKAQLLENIENVLKADDLFIGIDRETERLQQKRGSGSFEKGKEAVIFKSIICFFSLYKDNQAINTMQGNFFKKMEDSYIKNGICSENFDYLYILLSYMLKAGKTAEAKELLENNVAKFIDLIGKYSGENIAAIANLIYFVTFIKSESLVNADYGKLHIFLNNVLQDIDEEEIKNQAKYLDLKISQFCVDLILYFEKYFSNSSQADSIKVVGNIEEGTISEFIGKIYVELERLSKSHNLANQTNMALKLLERASKPLHNKLDEEIMKNLEAKYMNMLRLQIILIETDSLLQLRAEAKDLKNLYSVYKQLCGRLAKAGIPINPYTQSSFLIFFPEMLTKENIIKYPQIFVEELINNSQDLKQTTLIIHDVLAFATKMGNGQLLEVLKYGCWSKIFKPLQTLNFKNGSSNELSSMDLYSLLTVVRKVYREKINEVMKIFNNHWLIYYALHPFNNLLPAQSSDYANFGDDREKVYMHLKKTLESKDRYYSTNFKPQMDEKIVQLILGCEAAEISQRIAEIVEQIRQRIEALAPLCEKPKVESVEPLEPIETVVTESEMPEVYDNIIKPSVIELGSTEEEELVIPEITPTVIDEVKVEKIAEVDELDEIEKTRQGLADINDEIIDQVNSSGRSIIKEDKLSKLKGIFNRFAGGNLLGEYQISLSRVPFLEQHLGKIALSGSLDGFEIRFSFNQQEINGVLDKEGNLTLKLAVNNEKIEEKELISLLETLCLLFIDNELEATGVKETFNNIYVNKSKESQLRLIAKYFDSMYSDNNNSQIEVERAIVTEPDRLEQIFLEYPLFIKYEKEKGNVFIPVKREDAKSMLKDNPRLNLVRPVFIKMHFRRQDNEPKEQRILDFIKDFMFDGNEKGDVDEVILNFYYAKQYQAEGKAYDESLVSRLDNYLVVSHDPKSMTFVKFHKAGYDASLGGIGLDAKEVYYTYVTPHISFRQIKSIKGE